MTWIDEPGARLHVAGNPGVNGVLDLSINQAHRAPNAVGIGTTTVPTAQLQVNGQIKDLTGYVTPAGGIIMYSGTYANLFDTSGLGKAGTPVEGWALCNGNNGTPNLLSQFIVGAGPNSAYGNNSGATGGSATHTLTISEMPAHTHNGLRNVWGTGQVQSSSHDSWGMNAGYYPTSSTGGSKPFNILPPYYALFYIMKL